MTDEPPQDPVRKLPFGISDGYALRVGRLIQAISTLEMMLETLIRNVTGLNEFDSQILIGRLDVRGKSDSLDALLACRSSTLRPNVIGHWHIAKTHLKALTLYRNWLAHGVLFYRGEDDALAVKSRGAQPPDSAVAIKPITLKDLDNSLEDALTALEYLGNVCRTLLGFDVPLPDKSPEPKCRGHTQPEKNAAKAKARPPRSSRR